MKSRLLSILKSPFFWIFSVIAAVVLIPAGFIVGSWVGSRGGDERQSKRVLGMTAPKGVIDETTGAYRGVKRGDTVASVRRTLGEPIEFNGPYSPQVAWGASWNGFNPPICRSWRRQHDNLHSMVYREVVFNIVGRRVCSYEVAGSGWKTTGGISAGDSVEDIEARLGKGSCAESNFTEDPFWKQWTCTGRTDSGIRMQFAGNPVYSVGIVHGR